MLERVHHMAREKLQHLVRETLQDLAREKLHPMAHDPGAYPRPCPDLLKSTVNGRNVGI